MDFIMPRTKKSAADHPIPVRRALKTLGQDLRDARRRRRISTQIMAERASISRTTLSKIEQGDLVQKFLLPGVEDYVLLLPARTANQRLDPLHVVEHSTHKGCIGRIEADTSGTTWTVRTREADVWYETCGGFTGCGNRMKQRPNKSRVWNRGKGS